ncbi:tyrosine-type recombinase/integrase [Streptococcus sp. zg-86]|uniref:Tyrosine-type recombinase/integrase n=1 Tax=Streptococcus zhangguiae TaxID=2664091 RepID=A0A6I4RSN3_9STRE|nr:MULTISPECIES: site-specific integrase [unclassified Streptococcus]MTB63840.1 tyrosine-type recombinase/integrase [Streptococcus sp. zg-86]MTB90150.1 tyrosine-type recombinase/integrase [Streptococcus sp. zg-36]MWV55822.1 tyrosine-type recombinase/integrase [Streptococcus sp. zg-70]QTH47895.1 site-specific integrase [Streptococcus sp. zg-86]
MKITEVKKKNGSTVYRANIYLGIDQITGKKIKTSITGRTKKEVSRKVKHAQQDFANTGATRFTIQTDIKTINDLAEAWLENYQNTVKPQTLRGTKILIKNHILPTLGQMPLDRFSTPVAQKFINDLARCFNQFDKVRSVLSRMFQYAVVLQTIQHNPVRDTMLPRKNKPRTKKVKYIQPEDLKKFLAYVDGVGQKDFARFNYTVAFKLLLATGMRIGELSALEWSDINLKDNTIKINKTYLQEIKAVGETKTKAGERIISVDKATALMLKQYKNRQRLKFLEIGARAPVRVFQTPTRQYLLRNNFQQVLDLDCKNAGIPRFTFHAFRHTHASLLLNAGISYKELQHRLGHSNISMTLDTYSHLSKDKEKEAVIYFEKAINNL